MKICEKKLEIMLARKEMTKSELGLKNGLNKRLITRCTRQEIKPISAGKIAKVLGVDILDLLED